MSRPRALLLLTLLLLPWLAGPLPGQSPNVVMGLVIRSAGPVNAVGYSAVVGARVRLTPGDRETTTNEAGVFEFSDTPPGSYLVRVEKDGQTAVGAAAVGGPMPGGLLLVLDPPGTTRLGLTPVGPGTVYAALSTRGTPGTPPEDPVMGPNTPIDTYLRYPTMLLYQWGDLFKDRPVVELRDFQGQTPVTASPNAVMMLPPENPALSGYLNFKDEEPLWLAFDPTGTRLYVACSNRVVRCFDPATGKKLGGLTAPGLVGDLAVSPDGQSLALGLQAPEFAVLLAPARTLDPVRLVPTPGPVRSLAFSPDGGSLYMVVAPDQVARMDLPGGQFGAYVFGFQQPTGLALADGKVYVCETGIASVSVLEAPSLGKLTRVAVGAGPTKAAAALDGKVVVTNRRANTVSVLRGTSQVGTVEVDAAPTGVAVSQDGKRAYVGCREAGTVVTIDLDSFRVVHRTTGQPWSGPFGIAVRPAARP